MESPLNFLNQFQIDDETLIKISTVKCKTFLENFFLRIRRHMKSGFRKKKVNFPLGFITPLEFKILFGINNNYNETLKNPIIFIQNLELPDNCVYHESPTPWGVPDIIQKISFKNPDLFPFKNFCSNWDVKKYLEKDQINYGKFISITCKIQNISFKYNLSEQFLYCSFNYICCLEDGSNCS